MGKPPLANPEGSIAEYIGDAKATQGSEPSQYLQEQKTIVIPLVAASERGTAQTAGHVPRGCGAGTSAHLVPAESIWKVQPQTVTVR